jgi:hypothetical protein
MDLTQLFTGRSVKLTPELITFRNKLLTNVDRLVDRLDQLSDADAPVVANQPHLLHSMFNLMLSSVLSLLLRAIPDQGKFVLR